jgi:DNA-binding PadR family transcriptional regulator
VRSVSVRHALLGPAERGPKYGLQLRQEFEARTGEVWPLNVGQVYTTLQRLERDGLVESDDSADEGPQKGFHITEEGADELAEWLRTPPDFSSPPRDELVIKVLVALAARRRRARGGPGAPALPGRADAAVDAPQGGRVPLRPQASPWSSTPSCSGSTR